MEIVQHAAPTVKTGSDVYQRKAIATRARRATLRKAAREQLATVNLGSHRLAAKAGI